MCYCTVLTVVYVQGEVLGLGGGAVSSRVSSRWRNCYIISMCCYYYYYILINNGGKKQNRFIHTSLLWTPWHYTSHNHPHMTFITRLNMRWVTASKIKLSECFLKPFNTCRFAAIGRKLLVAEIYSWLFQRTVTSWKSRSPPFWPFKKHQCVRDIDTGHATLFASTPAALVFFCHLLISVGTL